jgi:hypothetical protein
MINNSKWSQRLLKNLMIQSRNRNRLRKKQETAQIILAREILTKSNWFHNKTYQFTANNNQKWIWSNNNNKIISLRNLKKSGLSQKKVLEGKVFIFKQLDKSLNKS